LIFAGDKFFDFVGNEPGIGGKCIDFKGLEKS